MPRNEPAQSNVSPKPPALLHDQPKRRPPSPNSAAPLQMRRVVPRKPASLHSQPSRSAVERRRRSDMGGLLATLQALLPTALKKRGRRSHCAILTEATNYIAALQEQLAELALKKAAIIASKGACVTCADNGSPDDGNASTGKNDSSLLSLGSNRNSSIKRNGWSNVEVSPAERDIFITMSTSDIKGLLSEALLNLQKFNLDVLSACLSTNAQLGFLSIHCQRLHSADQLDIGKVRDELHQLVGGEGMKSGYNENCVDGRAEASNTGLEGTTQLSNQALHNQYRPRLAS